MYLTHKKLDQYWIIDIETDPIPSTKIHCIVVRNAETGYVRAFRPDQLDDFVSWLDADREIFLVGHNAISFDVPTINRLLGCSFPLDRVVDTLVLSYLYDPRMPRPQGLTGKKGPHSLEAWGLRLKMPKGDFHKFDKFTPEMLEYCIQDVAITCTLFLRLTERMRIRGFSERSCQLEHDIRIVIDEQERNGFAFNRDGAVALANDLRSKQTALGQSIQQLFPPVLKRQGSYSYRLKKDGEPVASYLKHCEQYPKIEWDGVDEEGRPIYHVLDWQEFNIGSPNQRIEKLLSLGWEPQKFTEKGNPQVDEESLLAFAEIAGDHGKEVRAIAEWLVLQGRATMVEGWIENCGPDGRIHGRVFTCGAGTRRMTHNSPNTANIPKAKKKVPYGIECRSLWTVADKATRRLVGYDAAGLEMRCFAHYLNNPQAAELYTTGDPHQFNADLLNIERDPVKNVFYAFIYGAANEKLGWTGNTSLVSPKEQAKFGKWIREKLVENTPGLKELTDQIAAEGEWIATIDGGFVRCFSPHARINYKLQSAGGIVMKQSSIFIAQRIKERGLDALKVGDIHDEGQFDCDARCAEEVGQLCVQALRDAGEELGFRVPLDGDYKVGLSWAETH